MLHYTHYCYLPYWYIPIRSIPGMIFETGETRRHAVLHRSFAYARAAYLPAYLGFAYTLYHMISSNPHIFDTTSSSHY